jgi:uncharacterized membrane protein YhfC
MVTLEGCFRLLRKRPEQKPKQVFLVSDPLCLFSSLAHHCFPIILFWTTTLLTGMTGISLHIQWPLTSQSHVIVSQREKLLFLLQIKLHALIRLGVSPPSCIGTVFSE